MRILQRLALKSGRFHLYSVNPACKSATFLNQLSSDPLYIRSRVDAKSGYFLSGDVTRSSPVFNRERQSKMQI